MRRSMLGLSARILRSKNIWNRVTLSRFSNVTTVFVLPVPGGPCSNEIPGSSATRSTCSTALCCDLLRTFEAVSMSLRGTRGSNPSKSRTRIAVPRLVEPVAALIPLPMPLPLLIEIAGVDDDDEEEDDDDEEEEEEDEDDDDDDDVEDDSRSSVAGPSIVTIIGADDDAAAAVPADDVADDVDVDDGLAMLLAPALVAFRCAKERYRGINNDFTRGKSSTDRNAENSRMAVVGAVRNLTRSCSDRPIPDPVASPLSLDVITEAACIMPSSSSTDCGGFASADEVGLAMSCLDAVGTFSSIALEGYSLT